MAGEGERAPVAGLPLRTDAFDYELPQELIAQRPASPRDAARLLVLDRASGELTHATVRELPRFLSPGDLIVLNDTRVMPARLVGEKAGTGGAVEVLLLDARGPGLWEALVRPGRRLRPGAEVVFGGGALRARVVEATPAGGRILRFEWEGRSEGRSFEEVLHRLGEVPLPPYIKEKLDDPERYQTVFSREEGSKAAPTAGLHFTPELLARLEERGVEIAYVTLHVGLGTFRPVKAEYVHEHRMHAEYYRLPAATAEAVRRARSRGGRVVAVGTTVVRTLEAQAAGGEVEAGEGWTEIFIYPGYEFKAVDALLTNFHLPRSTLLMLVCAFAGRERVLEAYERAKQLGYRFFSFGDAMLIL